MGSKGPLFVFLIGVFAIVAFGVMAQVAFEKSSALQDSVEYRSAVVDRFPVTEVGYGNQPPFFELQLTVDPARLPNFQAQGWEQSPVAPTLVARHFREQFPLRLDGRQLRVRLVKETGFGCRSSQTLGEAVVPTAEELSSTEQRLQATFGSPCKLTVVAPAVLRVESPKRKRAPAAKALIPHLLEVGGGGWQRFEFHLGGLRFNFDPEGNRAH